LSIRAFGSTALQAPVAELIVAEPSAPAGARPARWRRVFDSDLWWSFTRSPVTVAAAGFAFTIIAAALLAPLIAPHDPYDLASVSLLDATDPPAWLPEGSWTYPLGTDNQGRDVLSAILYGTRLSLLVGCAAVALALLLGVTLGLVAGWRGGFVDAVIMRVADVQLSFPAILIALLIDGVARSILPHQVQTEITLYVLVAAIALSYWVHFARTVRGSTMVERNKEYIQAAQVTGVHPARILVSHLLPNVIGPVLVIATINLATAILTEATLSFLGVGLPPTEPSLGTLIRVGNDFLLSGDWWISVFPGIVLALLILSINLLGDWLRDVLNPKLR
jgi:peptide/nickel transport system permease protein